MNEIKQYSAIIPIEEYEALKNLRADKARIKQELHDELIRECGTHHHHHEEIHNLKGLGVFGGFLGLGGIIAAQIISHADWFWIIGPALLMLFLFGKAMEDL